MPEIPESRFVRRDVNSQIKNRCAELGLAAEFKMDTPSGPMRWHIDGEVLTPGEAADKYLPGGFNAAYGNGFGR